MTKDEMQLFRELSDHAQKQIDRAWKAYAILAGLLTVGAAFIFGSIGSFKESLRAEYRGQMESAQALLKQEVSRAFAAENVQRTVSAVISEKLPIVVETEVSNRTAMMTDVTMGDVVRKVAELDATAVRGVFDPKTGAYKLLMGPNTNVVVVPK